MTVAEALLLKLYWKMMLKVFLMSYLYILRFFSSFLVAG